ncbi:MAG: type VI secretion system ATPase TssH, partial [Gemmataceae bacterium]|nr:type VI secretion system ATPase TssH [Gemmataceae bacterium]
MNLQKFTEKAQEAVVAARTVAEENQQQELDVDHMLLALAEQEGGVVPRLLRLQGADPAAFAAAIRGIVSAKAKVYGHIQVYLGGRLSTALSTAEKEAERLKDDYVSTEHVFLGCVEQAEGKTRAYLNSINLDRDRVYQALVQLRGNQRVTDPNPESKYEALE